MKRKLLEEFSRFHHPALDPDLVHTFGASQWAMRVLRRAGAKRLSTALMRFNDRSIAKPVQGLMSRKPVAAVWAYDLSALEVFQAAKERGITTILDRTIGHPAVYNRIISSIHREYSEFFDGSDFLIPTELVERADREHQLADHILVGSDFCRSTLNEYLNLEALRRVSVLPYCFDDVFFKFHRERRERSIGQKVQFIFLGQAGPRKGIHLILKAMARVARSAAHLTIVGELQIPKAVFAKYSSNVTHMPSIPRHRVREVLQRSDCLVFPTYYEGSGLTIYEAMACGVGVIQSRNANLDAIPDAGLALSTLTEDSVYEALMHVIETPALIATWRHNGPKLAKQFTFQRYSEHVLAFLARNGILS